MSCVPVIFLKAESSPADDYRLHFSPSPSSSSPSPRIRYSPTFIPVLDHVFDLTNLQYIRRLFLTNDVYRHYSGIVFTSQRAVEAFDVEVLKPVATARSNEEANLPKPESAGSTSPGFSLFTVGPATHSSLEEAIRGSGLPPLAASVITGKEAGTGENLAHAILDHFNNRENKQKADSNDNDRRHLPLLFLTGKKHRDSIPKILQSKDLPVNERVPVEEVIVYETQVRGCFDEDFEMAVREAMHLSRQAETAKLNEGSSHLGPTPPTVWIVAFSPSGCQSMLRVVEKVQNEQNSGTSNGINSQLRIATIGPTTRNFLVEKHGVQTTVCAKSPTPEAVAEAIDMAMKERQHNTAGVM